MKKTLLAYVFILLFGLSLNHVYCQSYPLTWSPVVEKGKGLLSGIFLNYVNDSHYFLLNKEKKNFSLLKYDLDHKFVSELSIPAEFGGEKIGLRNLIGTQKGDYGIFSSFDKQSSSVTIIIAPLLADGFGQLSKATSFKIKPNLLDPVNITAFVSDDGKAVALITTTSADTKKSNKKISLALFDSEMKKLWDKTEELKYDENELYIYSQEVSSDGKIYLLGLKDNKAGTQNKNAPSNHSLFCFSKDEVKEFSINIGATYEPEHVALLATETGFVVSGFYLDANQAKDGLQGVFFTAGDMTQGITTVKVTKFEPELLEGLVKKRKLAKGKGLNSTFNIGDFFQLEDGSLGFVAENQYAENVQMWNSNSVLSSPQMATGTAYFADDLLIPFFTKEGDVIRFQKIEKHSPNVIPLYNYFLMTQDNENIYLVFTASIERDKLFGGTKDTKHYTTNLAVINKKGELLQNKPLFDDKDSRYDVNMYGSKASNTAILIETAGKHKQYGLVKIR